MIAVEEAAAVLHTAPACDALGLPRASLYRQRQPARVVRPRPTPPRALDLVERQTVLTLLHTRFVDQAPAQVHATLLDEGKRDAPQQRSGVVGQLNMVGDALDLLPAEAATRQRWSTRAWAPQRQGWIFLTSTPETRESLKPLYSLWFDLLVLRLMNQGRPGVRPVWFVIDELASLQRLPQLHTAITENRKSHNPVVLGFQSRSQLEILYGQAAETMISQPATKIFLRTSEPEAAKWVSDAIGAIEIERLAESRSKGQGPQQSYGLERQIEPLVMDSEITGLPDLHGYLKLGNLVVRLRVPYRAPIEREPGLLERPLPGQRPHVSVRSSPTVDVSESPAEQQQQQSIGHDLKFG